MQTSFDGLALIRRFEGKELKAYQDIAGVWTIGYGHTEGFKDGRFDADSVITDETATALLEADLKPREQAVSRLVTAPISQKQFDALVSLVYNIGIGAFERSTVLRKVNAQDWESAADAFLMWNKARVNGVLRPVLGLTRRREAEAEHFRKGSPKTEPEDGIVAEPGNCAREQSITAPEGKARKWELFGNWKRWRERQDF